MASEVQSMRLRWSEKEGLREVRSAVQDAGMDERLRTGLWNALWVSFISGLRVESDEYSSPEVNRQYRPFLNSLWHNCLVWPLNSMPPPFAPAAVQAELQKHFLKCDWRDAYEMLAFCAQNLPATAQVLVQMSNDVLEREMSAWHFLGNDLVRVMTEPEMKTIAQALDDAGPYAEVQEQLRKALALFSSREKPDHHNAIKEAVSAVETLGRLIVHDEKITLGASLHQMKTAKKLKPLAIHDAVLDSFGQLYRYASDEGMIRHAAKPPSHRTVGFAEAQMMLGACASAISYLIAKANAGRIPLTMEAP